MDLRNQVGLGCVGWTMKAITYDRYGDPEVLTLTDLPEPKVGPDEVLVRVRSASVNPVGSR